MMSNQFEQQSEDQQSMPAGIEENLSIEIEEQDTNVKEGVRTNSWIFPPKLPKQTQPVKVDWHLPSTYLTAFEASQHARTPKGVGYLVQATFVRNPFYLVGERTRSIISTKDRMYMAYWCSLKPSSWFCRATGRFYQGSQTQWLPVSHGGGTVPAVWIPGKDYDPLSQTVTYAVMIKRVRGNKHELVKWLSANGASDGYTGHPNLRPSNARDDDKYKTAGHRVRYSISRNNPRGFQLEAKPKYRRRLDRR